MRPDHAGRARRALPGSRCRRSAASAPSAPSPGCTSPRARCCRRPTDFARLVFEVVEDAASTARCGSSRRSTRRTTTRDRRRPETSSTSSSTPPPTRPREHGIGVGHHAGRRPHRRPVGRGRAGAPRRAATPTAAWSPFGLANDEAIGPPEPFADAFAIARDAGLLSTPHAGELAGPESVVGRARRARRRPPAARRARDRGPRAGEAPRRLAARASTCAPRRTCCCRWCRRSPSTRCPQLLDAGVACSLNADDPLLFGPVPARGVRARAAPSWGSTTTRSATVARASIDAIGRARRRSRRGATVDRRLARDVRAERRRPHRQRHDGGDTATTGSGHA